jgi:hypothetical protein
VRGNWDAADTIRAVAVVIKECKAKKCDGTAIVEGVSNILLAVSPVVGAAFPPAGIAIAVIASFGLLFSSLAYEPPSPGAAPLTPSMIQDAVRRSLVSFTVAQDTELLEQYAVFINIDLDNFVRHSGSLAYIRKQRGNDGQVLIDKQVCGIRSFF